jgi:ankyrin repeat protein
VAEILLAAHCDVNVQNLSEWTALHCAASHKMVDMVKLLIVHGANINIVDKVSVIYEVFYITVFY